MGVRTFSSRPTESQTIRGTKMDAECERRNGRRAKHGRWTLDNQEALPKASDIELRDLPGGVGKSAGEID